MLGALLSALGAANVLLLLRALPGGGGARAVAAAASASRAPPGPCGTASARWETRGAGECSVRTGYLASDGVHLFDIQAFSTRQVVVVSLANDEVERIAGSPSFRYREVPPPDGWQPRGERQDAEIAPIVAGLLGAPVSCVRVYDFSHERSIRLVKLTICDLEQPLPAPMRAWLASSAWRWREGPRRADRGAGASAGAAEHEHERKRAPLDGGTGDALPGDALSGDALSDDALTGDALTVSHFSALTVSHVSAVYSFTPHAASLVSLAQRTGVRHTYLGVCDRSQDGALIARYEAALRRPIAEGRVTLLAIDLPAVGHRRTKSLIEDVDIMGLCKLPAYQMALYDAKRAGDELLYVSDLDELLVPQRADSIPRAVLAATRGKDLAKLCYVRVHADEHPYSEFSAPRNASAARFRVRCDCPRARPEREDEFASDAETCGDQSYTKSLAIVPTTWFAGSHTQYGCSETDGAIHPSLVGKTNRYDWPRPKSGSAARRPWADPDELRIAHFTNLWKTRTGGCGKLWTTVPAEYARFL